MTASIIQCYPILDKDKAISGLSDSKTFLLMLDKFLDTTLNNNLLRLKIALDDFNYTNARIQCNMLMSSAGYLYALRVKAAAWLLSKSIEERKLDSLIENYGHLIKQCIYLKHHVICEGLTQEFVKTCNETPIEKETGSQKMSLEVPLSKYFEIVGVPPLDFEVCLVVPKSKFLEIPILHSGGTEIGIKNKKRVGIHVRTGSVACRSQKDQSLGQKKITRALPKKEEENINIKDMNKIKLETESPAQICTCNIF